MINSRSHLLGDPFRFRQALDYLSRSAEVRQQLSKRDIFELDLAVKNFIWVLRRALLTLNSQCDEEVAAELWHLDSLTDFCQYCRRCPHKELLEHVESVCKIICAQMGCSLGFSQSIGKVIEEADCIQRIIWKCKSKDIYKKVKDVKYLDERPGRKAEVVEDVMTL